MTKDEIIGLALDSGITCALGRDGHGDLWQAYEGELIKFYHAIRNKALEDAALTCEGVRDDAASQAYPGAEHEGYKLASRHCAGEIRAMKEES